MTNTSQPEALASPDDVRFHGRRLPNGDTVITIESLDGTTAEKLPHHVKHSPTGFNWGYGGSGAAETARCLLLASLPNPYCRVCGGTRKRVPDGVPFDGSPRYRPFKPGEDRVEAAADCHDWNCDDGFAVLPYQSFKEEFVAAWEGDEWFLPRSAVTSWLLDVLVDARSDTRG